MSALDPGKLAVRACTAVYLCSLQVPNVQADGPAADPQIAQLKRLSLEELSDVEVTSVARREQSASEAAAAVHVITEEDIRRSGARSIPEALRLAPNLQVAQTGSRSWAISARGFNASFANKLLVLIDGRAVYSPLFAGVFWDAQDTLLEDIDRIEVISGPGATLWGANAVNGIINVLTKQAKDTQGIAVSAAGGTEERVLASFRYGGEGGSDSHYRFYAKYFDRDDSVLAGGESAVDSWYSGQTGFRVDWSRAEDLLTLQGDFYTGHGEQAADADISQSGGNLLARWTRTLGDTEHLQVQAYYDRTHLFAPGDFGDDLDTFDVDAQYERPLGDKQRLMAGAGYRFSYDEVENLPDSISFLPATLERQLFSAFVQDEISLFDDSVKLTVGSKFEHNDYTGFEVQPSVRAAWLRARQVWWSAISRAVRTPSRFDRHLFFPATAPFIFAGGPAFDSEHVIAYELGWRLRPATTFFASATAFYNDYGDIRSTSPGPPFFTENNVEGRSYGIELEATWQMTDTWRLIAGYSLLQEDFRVQPGKFDLNAGQGEAFDPQQQAQLRSSVTVAGTVEFDVWVRYVDEIANAARGFGVVPDYLALDVRLGWSPTRNLHVSVVGQNLLDEQHAEFGFRQIQRAVYAKAIWRH
jgi:iron complex outermembrane recepter protein